MSRFTGLICLTLACAVPACDSNSNGEPEPGSGGNSTASGGESGDGDGDSSGGSSTGGKRASGGETSGSGGQGGASGGGGSDGGAVGSGGVVNPFDEYPDWVQGCSAARSIAACGGCIDAKCVFCLYSTPEEREEYNATHEGLEGCGTPNPAECTLGCSSTVSGCPPCAQQ